jgi:hypothetical protein
LVLLQLQLLRLVVHRPLDSYLAFRLVLHQVLFRLLLVE